MTEIPLLVALTAMLAGSAPVGDAGDPEGRVAEGTTVQGADLNLLGGVRRLAKRIEGMGAAEFERPPLAVRAPPESRRVAAEIRVARSVSTERLEARGRAWRDIGLGNPEAPRLLYLSLARDLDGIGFDPTGPRLLLDPELLDETAIRSDGERPGDLSLLMATGVTEDEPVVAHALVHLSRWERSGRPGLPDTTDALLARAAWTEGEANLTAVTMVFEAMGLEDEVLRRRLDPTQVLQGRLVPGALEAPGPVGRLLTWTYRDAFVQAAAVYGEGGWSAVSGAMAARRTTRDVIHLDREPVTGTELSPGKDDVSGELDLVDRDSVGEAGVSALVATWTGKDNLGMLAGDGWVADALYRWEDPEGDGLTLWLSRWVSEREARDFVYAYRRVLEGRFPDAEIVEEEGGRVRVDSEGRRTALAAEGAEVRLRVSDESR